MEQSYFALITVIVSGFFGLLVASVSSCLTQGREFKIIKERNFKERIKYVERVYVDTLSAVHIVTQRAHTRDTDFPRIQAQLLLISTKEIVEQFIRVGEALENWATEYNKSQPKTVGESSYSIIQSGDSEHRKKADELYRVFHPEMKKFETLLRNHLDEMFKSVIL